MIGSSVLIMFFVLLGPFLNDAFQVFKAVFPVYRGLYEDKVANFWCALSVILKLREMFNLDDLMKLRYICLISASVTLIVCLPACFHLFYKPTTKNFINALSVSSLGFFLFSFQVHEKSILLPLLPITMTFDENPLLVTWFNTAAVYSLWPLLSREKSQIAYFSSLLLWNLCTVEAWKKARFIHKCAVAV